MNRSRELGALARPATVTCWRPTKMTTGPESRPNFAHEPAFIDAVKRIGRKRIAHEIHDPEARELLGFGMLEARDTVARILAESASSKTGWRRDTQNVT